MTCDSGRVSEALVEYERWLFVASIGRPDCCEIFLPNHALRSDRLLGPLNDRVPVPLEPDVREHAGPATVAIEKRMNPHRPVMQPHRLVQKGVLPHFPEDEIFKKSLELHRNLVPITAEVQVCLPEFTGPFTYISKHLTVQPLRPRQMKGRRALGGLRRQVLHHDLANVLGFCLVQLRTGVDVFSLQSRSIDGGFTGLKDPVAHSSLQSLRFEPARSSCVVCSTIDSNSSCQLPDLRARMSPGPLQRASVPSARTACSRSRSRGSTLESIRRPRPRASAMARTLEKLAAAWRPDRMR